MIVHYLVGAILVIIIVAGIVSGIVFNEVDVKIRPHKPDRRKKRPAAQSDYVDGFLTAEALNELEHMFK